MGGVWDAEERFEAEEGAFLVRLPSVVALPKTGTRPARSGASGERGQSWPAAARAGRGRELFASQRAPGRREAARAGQADDIVRRTLSGSLSSPLACT